MAREGGYRVRSSGFVRLSKTVRRSYRGPWPSIDRSARLAARRCPRIGEFRWFLLRALPGGRKCSSLNRRMSA